MSTAVNDLAYECYSRYQGPHPCGPAEYWSTRVVMLAFGAVGALILIAMVVLWAIDVKRPWRRAARAEQARQRGLDALGRRERERRAAPPPETPEPFRRRSGNQPW